MTTQTSPSRSSRISAFKAIILCLLAGFSSVAFAQSTYLTSKEPESCQQAENDCLESRNAA